MAHAYGLKVKILDSRIGTEFPLPSYATPGSAALDLRACIDEPLTVNPGEVHLIHTGIAAHISDPWLCGLILPRSGLGHKNGIIMGNGTGCIDSDYTSELFVSCWNRSDKPYTIEVGERIAQLVLVHIARPGIQIVEDFEDTERGGGGFGSTGKI